MGEEEEDEEDTDQVIDYFVSHSWDHPSAEKIQVLLKVSEAFEKRHGRKPRFWIDKFCADPADTESNSLLWPIYMMACRQVLVLYSDTYKDTLKCVYDLYNAYATSSPGILLHKCMAYTPGGKL